MKGLLIGESATPRAQLQAIADRGGRGPVGDRLIHIRTEHLGPDELLVAAKVEFATELSVPELARAIDEVERRVRGAVPEARLIFLEPDISRARCPHLRGHALPRWWCSAEATPRTRAWWRTCPRTPSR